MLIYKIFRKNEWTSFMAAGQTAGSAVDIADGFMHFSTAHQLAETAEKHFKGEIDLVLASVNASQMGNVLKWETSRGGALFPHLYRILYQTDIANTHPIAQNNDGIHLLPSGLI